MVRLGIGHLRRSLRIFAPSCDAPLTVVGQIGTLWGMKSRSAPFSLVATRINLGHSRRSLAVKLGIDRRTLVRLEEGKPVHPAKAKVVADFFEVQVTDLMPLDPDEKAAAA